MKVKITNLAKNPMQSGLAKSNLWLVSTIEESQTRSINDLTGWTSSNNTSTQLKIKFSSKDEAIKYAKQNNFDYVICEARKSTVKAKSYSENFPSTIIS